MLLILAAGVSLTLMLPASAQTSPWPEDQAAPAAESAATPDADDADIKDLQLDWSQLNVDASTLATRPVSKARSSQAEAGGDMSWSSKNSANGSAAVSVKQPLSPFWDTRIGADMTVARQPSTMSELLAEKVANGGNTPQSTGTAWAAITAPGVGSIWDKTAVEARVDPGQEQSRLGTSLSKSLPLSDQYSLTLQNGYNVTQQGIVPVPGIVARPERSYQTEQSAKLSIADTGTSLIAGQTLSSTDDKWLRKIGAEQKLFDGVSITGSIGETPLGAANKSLTAGFKRSW
ncbi:hypothetical protein [Bradyrhizobium sp.]|uniref:hypothetical protein n=1 Tax=Bradyrhizobium sp. TaxID=376 RepID=UPI0025BD7DFC|nr:hypothetical protein [Bradyrhizobium sp.]